jgi:hypothetical protein
LTHVCQFTTPTLKIPIAAIEFSDAGRGSVGNPATGIKPVLGDGPSYRRTEGGLEESNGSAESE